MDNIASMSLNALEHVSPMRVSKVDGAIEGIRVLGASASISAPSFQRELPKVYIGPLAALRQDVRAVDALANHAVHEYRGGRTRSLREFAREQNIPLDD